MPGGLLMCVLLEISLKNNFLIPTNYGLLFETLIATISIKLLFFFVYGIFDDLSFGCLL
jgi:hypothetical protein